MERKKQYTNNEQVQNDLYQYEMGIELGADIEAEKCQHRNEYEKQQSNANCDQKGQNNSLQQNNQNRNSQNQQRQNSEANQSQNRYNDSNNNQNRSFRQ